MKKKIAILGSTGSIGTQALDVIRKHPDKFEAVVLTANENTCLLIKQAFEFKPDAVVIANEQKYEEVREALSSTDTKVYAGGKALDEIVTSSLIDMVLVALVGFSGLRPTISAIKSKKAIALANKETLVVAGSIIKDLVLKNKVAMLPVDSEHSAIFQCLMGEGDNKVDKIILTASGGPFRKYSLEQLRQATPAEALKHPSWKMGAKITIDSSTMMNKGFEVIEAKWLFDVPANKIEVVVHPESIVHSAVQFVDGAVKAQMASPDMRIPIQLAFTYPERLSLDAHRLDFSSLSKLSFEKPENEKFPCLGLAYEAIERGGNAPCMLNAANEIANLAFRENKIGFQDISRIISETIGKAEFSSSPTLDCLIETDKISRTIANNMIR